MLHHMKLRPDPYNKIERGRKTIELRLYDEKRRTINVGDEIIFDNTNDKYARMQVRVTALHVFDSFEKLYAALPLTKCGYTAEEVDSASPDDMNAYYTKEEQAEYGVVGIELEFVRSIDPTQTHAGYFLCKLLRHKPQAAGITLDPNGWANVDELLCGMNKTHCIDMAMLEDIVKIDSKTRFMFNEDKTKIRATQGHSVNVDVEPEELMPPEALWHGTGEKYTKSIEQNGLIAKTRLYVHLSADYDTAVNVGSRHGKPCVYKLDTAGMHADGFKFYRAVNGVWLTKYVPANYLTRVHSKHE